MNLKQIRQTFMQMFPMALPSVSVRGHQFTVCDAFISNCCLCDPTVLNLDMPFTSQLQTWCAASFFMLSCKGTRL